MIRLVVLALALSTVSAEAYYPQFANRYYDARGPRYYQPPRQYYAPPAVRRSYAPPRGYDWSWGGGNRAYTGGRGGGWGGEW